MNSNPHIIAVSGDPGGANALAPVIEQLRAGGQSTVEALAYRQACAAWQKRRLPFTELDERAEPALRDGTRLLLTSTSLNGVNLEQRFTRAARQRGIPSLCVLDFWSNYRRRFLSADGVESLPDKIAVMDAQAREEMIVEGFAPERLVITGQPAFDELGGWQAGFGAESRRRVREELGVNEDGLLVVFVSQPYSTLCRPEEPILPWPGYDEHSVSALLVKALERVSAETSRKITLVVRRHPREAADNLRDLPSDHIDIQLRAGGDGREMIAAADLVTGMNSALLIEACYLGRLVASLQPNLQMADALPTNRLGFSRAIYTEEEAFPAVRELLLDESVRRNATEKLRHFRTAGDAAQRVTSLAFSLLQGPSVALRS